MDKFSRLFHGIGILFLVCALGLTVYNIRLDNEAKKSSNEVLQTMFNDTLMSENTLGNNSENILESIEGSNSENTSENILITMPEYTTPNIWDLYPDMEMPVKKINGLNYIGILEIPDLSLTLPILKDWSYPQLRVSPCRYSGSCYKDNMVIMAHNYASHFGKLKNLSYGQLITFTDMDGNIFKYQVVAMEILAPTQVEEMIAGLGDLTLFTCTIGGTSRVTVGCERMK